MAEDRRLGFIAWLLKLWDWWSARSAAKKRAEIVDEVVDESNKMELEKIEEAKRAGADAVGDLRRDGVSEHTHFRD